MICAYLSLCHSIVFDPSTCDKNITAYTSHMYVDSYNVNISTNQTICIDFTLSEYQTTAVYIEGARKAVWHYGYQWNYMSPITISSNNTASVGRAYTKGNIYDEGHFAFTSKDTNTYNLTFFVVTKNTYKRSSTNEYMILSGITRDVISIGDYPSTHYVTKDLYLTRYDATAYIFYLHSGPIQGKMYYKKYSSDSINLKTSWDYSSNYIGYSPYSFNSTNYFSAEVSMSSSSMNYFTIRMNGTETDGPSDYGLHHKFNSDIIITNGTSANTIYPVDDESGGSSSGGSTTSDYVINGLVIAIGVYGFIIFVLLIANFIVACTYPNRLYRMGVTCYCCYCCCTDSYYHSQTYYAVHPHGSCVCCCDCGHVDCGDNDAAAIVALILILIVLIFIAFVLVYTLCEMLNAEEEERRWEETEIRHKQPKTVIITQQLVTVPTNSVAPPVQPGQQQYVQPGYAPPSFAPQYNQPYVPQPNQPYAQPPPAYAPPPPNPYTPPFAAPPTQPYTAAESQANPYEDIK